jgi:hypothetical protein
MGLIQEHVDAIHFTEAARARQKTEAFKKDYYQHRSGVEGSLSAFLQVAPLT